MSLKKLYKYGVTLKRLERCDIELLRKHRNNAQIKKYMRMKKHISKEEQLKWFNSLSDLKDYYLIIIYKKKKIGIIYFNAIEKSKGFSGIFFWHPEYIQSHIPILANFIGLEAFFEVLEGYTVMTALVHKENKSAMQIVRFLGYEKKNDDEFSLYELSRERYNNYTKNKIKIIQKITGDYKDIVVKY